MVQTRVTLSAKHPRPKSLFQEALSLLSAENSVTLLLGMVEPCLCDQVLLGVSHRSKRHAYVGNRQGLLVELRLKPQASPFLTGSIKTGISLKAGVRDPRPIKSGDSSGVISGKYPNTSPARTG